MFGKELLLCGSSPYPGYTRALLTVGEDHYSYKEETTEMGTYYYSTDGYGFTTTGSAGYVHGLKAFGTLTPSLGYTQLWAGEDYSSSIGTYRQFYATRPFYLNGTLYQTSYNNDTASYLLSLFSSLKGQTIEVYLKNA